MSKRHTEKSPPTPAQREEIFRAARAARDAVSRMSRSEKAALEEAAHASMEGNKQGARQTSGTRH